jgi:hypothetical protein
VDMYACPQIRSLERACSLAETMSPFVCHHGYGRKGVDRSILMLFDDSVALRKDRVQSLSCAPKASLGC